MPIYRKQELIPFLEGLGIRPKKGLSQNFLMDGNVVQKILNQADIQSGDTVLEVGPGPGALTEAMLQRNAEVFAVELDSDLAGALSRFEGPLKVFHQDILTFENFPEKKPFKVIGNLPYHISTPILTKLATMTGQISTMTVMVQEEMARRMAASPNTADWSSLSLFLNFYTHPSYAFKVSRHCFFPEPDVDSAIVHFTLKDPPVVSDVGQFFTLTRTAFNHKRKMLRASLTEIWPKNHILNALSEIGLSENARPQELDLPSMIALFEALKKGDF
jgi:16S rRNA (adenine1518-N6/adenine1519-N6)-dimethyltransferase